MHNRTGTASDRRCLPRLRGNGGQAVAKTIDETTCTVCAARLERRWNSAGTDFTWLDDSGRGCAGEGGPDGVASVEDYLDWLRIHDISGYSLFLAHVTLGTSMTPRS